MSSIPEPSATRCITDSLGRKLTVRSLTALDKLRLLKAAGPELSLNDPWLALAALASSVTSIDGVPVPFPLNETQVEGLIARLDEPGIDAVADSLSGISDSSRNTVLATAGNSSGTPI